MSELITKQELTEDMCFEILSYLVDDWKFIISKCSLISKEWFRTIKERLKFCIEFDQKMIASSEVIRNCQFIDCIIGVSASMKEISNPNIQQFCKLISMMKLNRLTLIELDKTKSTFQVRNQVAETIGKMEQLTELDIRNNFFGVVAGNFLCALKNLKLFNAGVNVLGIEVVKPLSQLKDLTYLDISENPVLEGFEYLGNMQGLTYLNVSKIEGISEGISFICQLTQLKSLDVGSCSIGERGAKVISQMKGLTELNISGNQQEWS